MSKSGLYHVMSKSEGVGVGDASAIVLDAEPLSSPVSCWNRVTSVLVLNLFCRCVADV